MPNKRYVNDAGCFTVTMDTTGTLNVGAPHPTAIGSWVFQVSGTFSQSIVLRKKVSGSTVADASAPTTAYVNHATDAAVTAGTAITAAGLFKVQCDGCDLIFDNTVTSGTVVIEGKPLVG